MAYQIIWTFVIVMLAAACGVNSIVGMLVSPLNQGKTDWKLVDYWPYIAFVLTALSNPWYNVFQHISLTFT
jgi:hypothetical protein